MVIFRFFDFRIVGVMYGFRCNQITVTMLFATFSARWSRLVTNGGDERRLQSWCDI